MADQGIFKPHATSRERIDIGSLDDIVAIAAKGAGRLIIGKKENDVRPLGRNTSLGNQKQQREPEQLLHGKVTSGEW